MRNVSSSSCQIKSLLNRFINPFNWRPRTRHTSAAVRQVSKPRFTIKIAWYYVGCVATTQLTLYDYVIHYDSLLVMVVHFIPAALLAATKMSARSPSTNDSHFKSLLNFYVGESSLALFKYQCLLAYEPCWPCNGPRGLRWTRQRLSFRWTTPLSEKREALTSQIGGVTWVIASITHGYTLFLFDIFNPFVQRAQLASWMRVCAQGLRLSLGKSSGDE